MQDPFPIPSCFFPSEQLSYDPSSSSSAKSGQSIVTTVYRTKIAGQCRLITITWCKDLLAHGFSVAVEGSTSNSPTDSNANTCKVELRPWHFWRKHGSKRFVVDDKPIGVFWDLRSAKFSREPEPQSGFFVAVASEEEVVLLLGDLKKEAYKRTGLRPASIDAIMVLRKEHIFGKKKFATTKAKFHEKDTSHDISIECSSIGDHNTDPEMVIKIDGHSFISVKHLQWKFRGNQTITIGKERVDVYWDVYDWLFSPGLRHALFIFKPLPPIGSSSSTSTSLLSLIEASDANVSGSSGFGLFLYAWKLE
ncbi:uncharacterized protein [Typha angustifolia]|uniref:uncharacterized protein n=1 Tax=Typha angustifolia TaxID=59011 RepID=UPI003C2E1D42